MTPARRSTDNCPSQSSPCNWARATAWMLAITVAALVPLSAMAVNHFERRADAATAAAREASLAANDLRTGTAVLAAKLDMLQQTMNEMRQDLKNRPPAK